jgi:hypothetical protein
MGVLFWLYLLATAILFGGVPWSKFAHMFFKPAARSRSASRGRTARRESADADP